MVIKVGGRARAVPFDAVQQSRPYRPASPVRGTYACSRMKDLGGQIAYWDGAGARKTFTHPVNLDWLAEVGRNARVLDYGCGYGRVMAELSDHGFSDVSGVDPSPALIERGRRLRPDLHFSVLESPPDLAYASAAFDAVLLFAVLTCIPDNGAQRALVAELSRVLAPGGLLYVSDLVLQDDERNRDRYAAHAQEFGPPYGVFATDDGVVCRHHDIAHLRALLPDFDLLEEYEIEVANDHSHSSMTAVRRRWDGDTRGCASSTRCGLPGVVPGLEATSVISGQLGEPLNPALEVRVLGDEGLAGLTWDPSGRSRGGGLATRRWSGRARRGGRAPADNGRLRRVGAGWPDVAPGCPPGAPHRRSRAPVRIPAPLGGQRCCLSLGAC